MIPLAPEKAAERLCALADRVRDLRISRHRPEAFLEDKSELHDEMRRLAGELVGRAEACRNPIERGRFSAGPIVANGRFVSVEKRGARRVVA